MGVGTIYNPFLILIRLIKYLYIIFFLIVSFSNVVSASENNNQLKIGLLVPFSGELKDVGKSIMLSLHLALREIDNKDITVVPRDSGTNDKKKLNLAITELKNQGVKIVIGPIERSSHEELKRHQSMIFISPSNISSEVESNIISFGINLESQLKSITNFLDKNKKTKTVIMFPDDEYAQYIEDKLLEMNIKSFKIFKYNTDPKLITSDIEKLTNYSQRKRNLENRKKVLEDKEDEESIKELEILEQKYTLGKVNYDSFIIIDFGNSLKSVLTSLIFVDVNQNEVLFLTANQWFDRSIFLENSVKKIFYPSINFKSYKKYKNNYLKTFGVEPFEISILTYDALGLIYYIWEKNKKINTVRDFLIKNKIKGKLGRFNFENSKLYHDLEIYRAEDNKFSKM